MSTNKTPMRFTRTPSVFTVDVDGQPVVSFLAANSKEASELLKEAWFRDELRTLKSGGRPLWDGRSPLRARPASIDEASRYREMAEAAGDEAGDLFLAFWVTLDGGRGAAEAKGPE